MSVQEISAAAAAAIATYTGTHEAVVTNNVAAASDVATKADNTKKLLWYALGTILILGIAFIAIKKTSN